MRELYKKYFRIFICGQLLGLYAVVFIGWDMLHAHAHQDSAVLHTPKVEKDSCHRSIFHGESDAHKSHVASFKHCASCHVISQPPRIDEVIVSPAVYSLRAKNPDYPAVFVIQPVTSRFSSRAPPTVV